MDKVQERLIQLSVGIEEKNKSIDTLIGSINVHNERMLKQFEVNKAKYLVELKKRSKDHSIALSQILQEYEGTTEDKEKVSDEVATLSAKMKQENEITKSRLLNMRETAAEKITHAAEEWNSCRLDREELWINKKIEHVRLCTVNALQPEIKRLSESHEAELSRLMGEASTRKQYLEREINLTFQRNFNLYCEENDRRKAILIEGRTKNWKTKIKGEEEKHRQNLMALRVSEEEESLHEGTSSNDLTERMREVTDSADEQLKDMEKIAKCKRDDINEKLASFNHGRKAKQDKIKDQWYYDQKSMKQKKLDRQMESFQKEVLKRRDSDMEALIRHYHRIHIQVESDFDNKPNDEVMLHETNRMSDEVKYVKNQNKSKATEISTLAQDIERLNKSRQTLLDCIETKEKRVKSNESKINVIRVQSEEISCTRKEANVPSIGQLNDLECQLSQQKEHEQSLMTEFQIINS